MSHRSITCGKSVAFDYPADNFKVEISQLVYPDDPDEPGLTVYSVDLGRGSDGHAEFLSVKNLERYHKAIGYFLDRLDKEGSES